MIKVSLYTLEMLLHILIKIIVLGKIIHIIPDQHNNAT